MNEKKKKKATFVDYVRCRLYLKVYIIKINIDTKQLTTKRKLNSMLVCQQTATNVKLRDKERRTCDNIKNKLPGVHARGWMDCPRTEDKKCIRQTPAVQSQKTVI